MQVFGIQSSLGHKHMLPYSFLDVLTHVLPLELCSTALVAKNAVYSFFRTFVSKMKIQSPPRYFRLAVTAVDWRHWTFLEVALHYGILEWIVAMNARNKSEIAHRDVLRQVFLPNHATDCTEGTLCGSKYTICFVSIAALNREHFWTAKLVFYPYLTI